MHSPTLTWGLHIICAGALPPRSLCCGLLSHCRSRPGIRQVSPPTPESQDPQEKTWIATYSPTGSPCKEHPLEAEGGPSFLFPCSEGSRFHQEQRSVYRFPGMLVPKSPVRGTVTLHTLPPPASDSTHQPSAPPAHFLAQVSAHIMVGWLVNFLSAPPCTLVQWRGKAHQ